MTGKLADTVMSVRNGEQLARKYQPVVYNPSTTAQVAQRAKMKLVSQLSAVMAPVIAIPRNGAVSSRNLFTKVNFPLTSFTDNEAEIALASVQITKSAVGLVPIRADRTEDGITVTLLTRAVSGVGELSPSNYSRVVYAMFVKGSDNKLRFYDSQVVTEPGTLNSFQAEFPLTTQECVFLAYAVRDNTEAARVAFGNMQTVNAETVASLIVTRSLIESDVTLTETRGYQLESISNRDGSDEEKKKTAKK